MNTPHKHQNHWANVFTIDEDDFFLTVRTAYIEDLQEATFEGTLFVEADMSVVTLEEDEEGQPLRWLFRAGKEVPNTLQTAPQQPTNSRLATPPPLAGRWRRSEAKPSEGGNNKQLLRISGLRNADWLLIVGPLRLALDSALGTSPRSGGGVARRRLAAFSVANRGEGLRLTSHEFQKHPTREKLAPHIIRTTAARPSMWAAPRNGPPK